MTMPRLTDRRRHMLTGAIAIVVLVAAMTVGIKGAFGAFKGGYELVGRFDSAGQGLLPGSDIKIRGVNVGEVKSIALVDGEARVKLRLHPGERIPTGVTATIRPKTLFGEKFIDLDPGDHEADGPFLADGEEIEHTVGGFELEQVLGDLYPLLKAIDPAELATVMGELADGGKGMGETINRTIVNSDELAGVFADNADNTRQFLTDLAALSDQLAGSADDLLDLADAGNAALPTLNDNEAAVVDLLQQTGRLSNDVADLLEHNRPFVESSFVDGSRTLQVLTDRRDRVVPLVIGLRQYLQTLASSVRIDAGDGTLMAAVKGVLGGQACPLLGCPGAGPAAGPDAPTPTLPALPGLPGLPALPGLPTIGLPPIQLPLLAPEAGTTTDDGDLYGILRKVIGG